MKVYKGFFDLCVNTDCVKSDEDYVKTIKYMYELGYRTIAINHLVIEEENEIEAKEKLMKGIIKSINVAPRPRQKVKMDTCNDMEILSRLTIQLKSPAGLHKIVKSEHFSKFDLVAAIPDNQQAVQCIANSTDIDIVSFDASVRGNVRVDRTTYYQFVRKLKGIEILYAPAIVDTVARKNVITTAHHWFSIGNSRNIIISSGANNVSSIRNPYDLIHLGLIFGLNNTLSKAAITRIAKDVCIKAFGRKLGKVSCIIEDIDDSDQNIAFIHKNKKKKFKK